MAKMTRKKEQSTLLATPVKRKKRTANPTPKTDAAGNEQMTLTAREHAEGAAAKSKKNAGSNSQIATRLASLSIMSTSEHEIIDAEVYPVSYDDCLLEQARTQWQFGDWDSLAKLNREALNHHPERAKLALLSAAGHLQRGDSQAAQQFTRLAREWGCDKRLVSQVLIAGVHNSLGRASAIAGQQPRALQHFENAIAAGTSGSEVRLVSQARRVHQLALLGLPSDSAAVQSRSDNTAPSLGTAPPTSAFSEMVNGISKRIREEVSADLKAANPNPYAHNRTLTPGLNKALRDFAEKHLDRQGLKQAYIDYLAIRAIQIERNCVGRLATTVQDAVARQLVAECVPGDCICILEIGALYGISLAILYNHAITRFQKVTVAGLDPFDGYYGKTIDAVLNNPVNDLTYVRNMRLSNVPQDDYRLIKRYSTDPGAIAAARELPINLLIIDGDHTYEGVKFDFETYFPLLEPGGYVIFDDYNAKEWPGVQQFIDQDLRETTDFKYLGAISRTAVGCKISAAKP